MNNIAILGAGNALGDIIELIELNMPEFKYKIFDDNHLNIGNSLIEGSFDDALQLQGSNTKYVFCFGTAKTTQKRKEFFVNSGLSENDLISLIHPTAAVSSYADLDPGVIVKANAVILPNAKVRKNVIISQLCSVSHHVEVGAHSILAPSSSCSGGSKIGEACFIGTNASINENIHVGDYSIVAIGAVARKNLEDNAMKLR